MADSCLKKRKHEKRESILLDSRQPFMNRVAACPTIGLRYWIFDIRYSKLLSPVFCVLSPVSRFPDTRSLISCCPDPALLTDILIA
jgi:hypothetical protein